MESGIHKPQGTPLFYTNVQHGYFTMTAENAQIVFKLWLLPYVEFISGYHSVNISGITFISMSHIE